MMYTCTNEKEQKQEIYKSRVMGVLGDSSQTSCTNKKSMVAFYGMATFHKTIHSFVCGLCQPVYTLTTISNYTKYKYE